MKEEAFFAGRHLAVQNMRSFFFLQKLSAKIQPAIQNPGSSLRRPSPAKKSDKNLHQPKNLVYYICKREGQLLPIRQTDSPSEFLSLLKILSPGCNPRGGVFVFVGKWHVKCVQNLHMMHNKKGKRL